MTQLAVTLDNNVWDFLCDNAVDLPLEFPLDRFALFIPREVGIEVQAIPGKPTSANTSTARLNGQTS